MAEERADATDESRSVEGVSPRSELSAKRSPGDVGPGQYLFCIVRVADTVDDPFTVEGIEGRQAGLIVAGDLAAVTQPCESLYDTSDPETIRRWLLRHQAVVDAAGEAFGTPLPCRFDTVVLGDADDVREWLGANADAIHDALDDVAGRWEYRIEVTVEDEPEVATLVERDERLADLDAEIEAADEGRAFLLEKQYEERVRALRRDERGSRAAELRRLVEPLADRVEWTDGPAAPNPDEASGDLTNPPVEGTTAPVSLTVLATPDAADRIGDELEAVADEPGVEVRYTGPWPPYTFAPAVGGAAER